MGRPYRGEITIFEGVEDFAPYRKGIIRSMVKIIKNA